MVLRILLLDIVTVFAHGAEVTLSKSLGLETLNRPLLPSFLTMLLVLLPHLLTLLQRPKHVVAQTLAHF